MVEHRMNKRSRRAKLIFNPISGTAGESPVQLMDVIHEMQAWKLIPEAYLVEPGCDLPGVIRDALEQGFRMFVVCGGDGKAEDPRIQHFHVRQVEIDTHPAMPVMADGNAVGEGLVRIRVRRHALTVMAGEPAPGVLPAQGAVLDEPTGESTKREEIACS